MWVGKFSALTVITVFIAVTILGGPASPQTQKTIQGKWSHNRENCAVERNYNGEYIEVDSDSVTFDAETGCFFKKGKILSPSHWKMTGSCESAGQYEGGGAPPISQIELFVKNGVLHITISGDANFKGSTSYTIKCGWDESFQ